MTLGELNMADIFESDPIGPFDAVGYVIFVIFLFFMPIVLINLTVGANAKLSLNFLMLNISSLL